eukprot:CAMPEP_0194030794 /NCGR_PEP_ID=MMETSP0009_2-20130614/4140_1 /TAXON_ID=210454 /ORGANISM="Grammatophora oceanica, Strain CCMP 410" /LENGTH=115 /DNA_ID=CAMNT_0038670797 /DNA_START=90 /DNA_END=437 /DNA_ORIENTATION=-
MADNQQPLAIQEQTVRQRRKMKVRIIYLNLRRRRRERVQEQGPIAPNGAGAGGGSSNNVNNLSKGRLVRMAKALEERLWVRAGGSMEVYDDNSTLAARLREVVAEMRRDEEEDAV